MNSSLSIVIPNFQGEMLLEKVIPNTLKIMKNFEGLFVLIDDGSTDNSVQIAKRFAPDLVIELESSRDFIWDQEIPKTGFIFVTKKKNEGFSSTVNLGAKYVSSEFMLILNSDVLVETSSIQKALGNFSSDNIAGVAIRDIDDEGNFHGRGKFAFEHGMLLHRAHDRPNESGKTAWVSCGSGIFRRNCWEEVGGLNEIYNPFYYEDVDLGWRIWQAGYELYFDFEASCTHLHSLGAIKKNNTEAKISSISYYHQIIFSWLHLNSFRYIFWHIFWMKYFIFKSFFVKSNLVSAGFLPVMKNYLKIWRLRRLQKVKFCDFDIVKIAQ